MTDADDYREHAAKIRRLVAGVRGHAATAALLLADEYESRATQLEGKPAAASYLGNADRVGELIARERAGVDALVVLETDLASQLARTREKRAIAEARIDAILATARLLDMPAPVRGNTPASFTEAATAVPPIN
ncbi:hypothetical protein [Glacieibacterium sp.]|uniref:hypothetical protein n=1 Tax=Glacieibacterium sp. TaxID=2860237 RepID=UPI003B00CCF2